MGKNTITISPNAPTNKSLDYNYLREIGIKTAQRLSGDLWTDYNHHDPGVTILEMICYAITELGYQTDMPIEELLHLNSKKEDKLPTDSFFKPQDIFTTNPVTPNDYRKLMIDRFPEIQNIWFDKSDDAENLYDVKVLMPTTKKRNDQSQSANKHLWRKIVKYFYYHRNLCEDINTIIFLYPKDFKLHVEASIDLDADADTVFAKILLATENVLTPTVHYHSLNDLIQDGIPIEDILNGIRPIHGFIKDEDLKPIQTRIDLTDVEKAIANVEGVNKIKSLKFFTIKREQREGKIEDKVVEVKHQIRIRSDEYARLSFDKDDPFQDSKSDNPIYDRETLPIHLDKNGKGVHISMSNVIQQLDHLSAARPSHLKIDYSHIENQNDDIKIRNIEYHTIQSDFPEIYALDETSESSSIVVNDTTENSTASIKQLRAYLLLFDQVMANYVSQLIHIRNLFSIDTIDLKTIKEDPKLIQTYASQLPKNVVNIEEILKLGEKGLQTLIMQYDPFIERKHRFIEHILARFGDDSLINVVTQYYHQNYYPAAFTTFEDTENNSSDYTLNQSVLMNKLLSYLQSFRKGSIYDQLNENESQEDNINLSYRDLNLGNKNKSLGSPLVYNSSTEIDDASTQFLFNFGRRALKTAPPFALKIYGLLDVYMDRHEGKIASAYNESVIVEKDESPNKNKEEEVPNKNKEEASIKEKLLVNLFAFGNNPSNYQIKDVNNEYYALNYYSPDQYWSIRLKESDKQEELLKALPLLIKHIEEVNQKSKGFYIVENELLRQKPIKRRYFYRMVVPVLYKGKEYKFVSDDILGEKEWRERKDKLIFDDLTKENTYEFNCIKKIKQTKENFFNGDDSTLISLEHKWELTGAKWAGIKFRLVNKDKPNAEGWYISINKACYYYDNQDSYQQDYSIGSTPENHKMSGQRIYINEETHTQFQLLSKELITKNFKRDDVNEDNFYKLEQENNREPDKNDKDKKDTEIISDDFYENRVSFIFPNWCSYFQGIKNQTLIQNLILDNIPMHISADIYHISPDKMLEFEKKYIPWKEDTLGIQLRGDLENFLWELYKKSIHPNSKRSEVTTII